MKMQRLCSQKNPASQYRIPLEHGGEGGGVERGVEWSGVEGERERRGGGVGRWEGGGEGGEKGGRGGGEGGKGGGWEVWWKCDLKFAFGNG